MSFLGIGKDIDWFKIGIAAVLIVSGVILLKRK